MRKRVTGLIDDRRGAVAPTLALSLFALIAAGGIAFDYARMASMDTELQNAADQAALAAASQLDGKDGACARAAAAASGMITNLTYMANETGSNRLITLDNEGTCDATGNIRFYQDKAKSQPATTNETAKFVEVWVNPREAFFALTPVVAAFSSGNLTAAAFAGLGEAICRVPPLMMCNPDEVNDPNFTLARYIGKGLRLVANDGGGNYGPGNFGFLDVGQGSGAASLMQVLGRQGDPGDCSSGTTVTTEPGNMVNLRDALNTRFDMFQNGLNQACGSDGTLCPPSANSRKDLYRAGAGQNACGFANNGPGWRYDAALAYPPAALTTDRELNDAEVDALGPMGYPRDICHAVSITGTCAGGMIGDGDWDRFAYFRSHRGANYPEVSLMTKADTVAFENWLQSTFGTTTPSRFQVYSAEMKDAANRLKPVTLANGRVAHGSPVCIPPGITPDENTIDRRVLSVAVINCAAEGVKGKTAAVDVAKHIDMFLVEPTAPRDRTEVHDVYAEIIGESATQGDAQTVKKAIPYLIE